ncbi:hypothetical protein CDL12_26517 [Handroanthus impetiginosus]|uniref:EF-hand domain-containing protein n=1 Tax=Handroanthus impetiginosus TaxID=429701 RepID=A0A2G9G7M9_9LAMI|nr:hypothetical protein CDL12_26517 [Handroanthus impetiginosus]
MEGHREIARASYEKKESEAERTKREMKELQEIAKAHYRAGSKEVQALAHKFFKTLDTDGDGTVSCSEFLAFMRQEDYLQMHSPLFFQHIDHDGNKTLDFFEVMTLYYIIKSERPFCDSCGHFIPDIFFSCVECFKNPKKPFNLCRDCYGSTECKHHHDGRVQFLDNYTLLAAGREPLAHAMGLNSKQTGPTTSLARPGCPPSPSANYSNAIVPAASTMDKWKTALKAFEIALSIGNISSTMCTIL